MCYFMYNIPTCFAFGQSTHATSLLSLILSSSLALCVQAFSRNKNNILLRNYNNIYYTHTYTDCTYTCMGDREEWEKRRDKI